MYLDHRCILSSATRTAWDIEDILPDTARLEFTRPFVPEALARTRGLPFLSAEEQRTPNQVRSHEHLSMFGLVEEFSLPFVLDHARPGPCEGDWRTRALLHLAGEDAGARSTSRVSCYRIEGGEGAGQVTIRGDGTPEPFADVHPAVMATSPNFHNMPRAVAMNAKQVIA